MLEPLHEAAWESATFSGTQHTLAVAASTSPRIDAWLAALRDIDLPMPGQFVAGMEVSKRFDHKGVTACTILALTIAA